MVCQRIGNAIVCGPAPRRRRCVGCGFFVRDYRLCDARLKGANGKTCDAPICSACTTVPAPEKDLCPRHAAQWKARLAS